MFALGFAVPCLAQSNISETDKQLTADVLKKTLFVRTLDEQRFCDYVIQKRDDGTIPTQLIYGVYRSAITKERGRRFTYFRSGLEILCRREKIVLIPPPVRASSTTPSFAVPSIRGFF